jgi:hypothetical protein
MPYAGLPHLCLCINTNGVIRPLNKGSCEFRFESRRSRNDMVQPALAAPALQRRKRLTDSPPAGIRMMRLTLREYALNQWAHSVWPNGA